MRGHGVGGSGGVIEVYDLRSRKCTKKEGIRVTPRVKQSSVDGLLLG